MAILTSTQPHPSLARAARVVALAHIVRISLMNFSHNCIRSALNLGEDHREICRYDAEVKDDESTHEPDGHDKGCPSVD